MTKDLTEGKITPILIRFTIPLVLGNLFQLTYNAVDSMIVGKFVGKEALAAVGICNPIMTMLLLLMSGLCMGASILMGNQYGAKDYDTLHRQISTTMIAGSVFSIVLTIVSMACSSLILKAVQVEASILPLTRSYLHIILLGLLFSFLYNFYTNVLRALGDSRTPLYFLMASAIFNIFGDLFFVIVLKWGSTGCALSTVISEALCSLFCILYVQKKVEILHIKKGWFVFDRRLLKKTIAYGWASALQQAVIPFGKIIMQSVVNTMGVSAAAAFGVCNRIDDFAYTPQQNIAHAMTAFMAQNLGAGKKSRMREGFKWGMVIEFLYGLTVLLVCFFGARHLMEAFTSDESVIAEGMKYLKLISFMYILPAMTNGIQGYFRGIGDLKTTLFSSTLNVVVRIILVIPMVLWGNWGIEALPIAYCIGWISMLIAELPLLIKQERKNRQDIGLSLLQKK